LSKIYIFSTFIISWSFFLYRPINICLLKINIFFSSNFATDPNWKIIKIIYTYILILWYILTCIYNLISWWIFVIYWVFKLFSWYHTSRWIIFYYLMIVKCYKYLISIPQIPNTLCTSFFLIWRTMYTLRPIITQIHTFWIYCIWILISLFYIKKLLLKYNRYNKIICNFFCD